MKMVTTIDVKTPSIKELRGICMIGRVCEACNIRYTLGSYYINKHGAISTHCMGCINKAILKECFCCGKTKPTVEFNEKGKILSQACNQCSQEYMDHLANTRTFKSFIKKVRKG